jgi:hypothetical protein
MKSFFNKRAWRRMGELAVILCLSGLIALPFAARGAQATWDSQAYGSIFNNGNLPQIDATNFVNHGTWNISVAPFPYGTSDTLNYTNKGVMNATVGWDFDLGPTNVGTGTSLRSTAGSFFNDNNGIINSSDNRIITTSGGATYKSYLWVAATNIVNLGTLEAGSSGQILLVGTNVNLSRSSVLIQPVTSSSVGATPLFTSPTNQIPPKGVTYRFWAQTNMDFVSGNLWDGSIFRVPTFGATGPCTTWTVSGGFFAAPNFTFYTNHQNGFVVYTNQAQQPVVSTNPTNIVQEAIFIVPPFTGTNLTADVRFTRSPSPTNYFDTVAVRLSQLVTNLATVSLQVNTFYLVDSLASTTNGGFYTCPPDPSSTCSDPTFDPQNYLVSRADFSFPGVLTYYNDWGNSVAFAGGIPGAMGLPPVNFLYDPTWTNNGVTAKYASLDPIVGNVTTPPPAGASIEHSGGRVQIHAGTLNLDRTLLSGEGYVQIQCAQLVGSAGAVVDCANLSYDLTSTNGLLVFTNLALPSVNHFSGDVITWSATWSNLTSVITPNWTLTSSNTVVELDLTNTVLENMYVLIVDASQVGQPIPVTVVDLLLHAANMVMGDSVVVTNSLLFSGQSLTIQKSVTLAGGLRNWVWTEAPALRYFTNNGSVTIPNMAHFGDDGPTNYLAFINKGTISAGGQTINSAYLQINKGTNLASASDFSAITQTGRLAGATVQALTVYPITTTNNSIIVTSFQPGGGAVSFTASSLQISNSTLSAYDSINFAVSGSLSDGGIGTSNIFACFNGFNLWTQPGSGDLLGTKVYDIALGQKNVSHSWAGQDSGVTAAGFANHTAIGTLVLYPASTVLEPLFSFYGTTGGNALYVNHLDLSYLGDPILPNEIYIDPTLTIYYAYATLNPIVNTNGYSSASAYLDNNPGLFGPRLRWVKGVNIPAPQAYSLSQRFTLTASYAASGGAVQLTTGIMPGQTNIIEASTDLVHWTSICTNIGSYTSIGVPTTFTDPGMSNYPCRFYRAVPGP